MMRSEQKRVPYWAGAKPALPLPARAQSHHAQPGHLERGLVLLNRWPLELVRGLGSEAV